MGIYHRRPWPAALITCRTIYTTPIIIIWPRRWCMWRMRSLRLRPKQKIVQMHHRPSMDGWEIHWLSTQATNIIIQVLAVLEQFHINRDNRNRHHCHINIKRCTDIVRTWQNCTSREIISHRNRRQALGIRATIIATVTTMMTILLANMQHYWRYRSNHRSTMNTIIPSQAIIQQWPMVRIAQSQKHITAWSRNHLQQPYHLSRWRRWRQRQRWPTLIHTTICQNIQVSAAIGPHPKITNASGVPSTIGLLIAIFSNFV